MDTERKTGFKFRECAGGFSWTITGLISYSNDKINVTVHSDMGNGRTAVYGIDMVLSKDYIIF